MSCTNFCYRAAECAAEVQIANNGTQTSRPHSNDFPSQTPFLTEHRLKAYRSLHGRPASKHERLTDWLAEVIDAMATDKLEDPERPQDPPVDEWDNIAWQRNVRHHGSPTHMGAWVNPSER